MKKTILLLSGIMVMSCTPQQKKLTYPKAEKVDTLDVYFGTEVADPYRWLENDTSAATAAWVEAENKVTNEYLAQIPFRKQLLERLTNLANYEKIGAPFKKHGSITFTKMTVSRTKACSTCRIHSKENRVYSSTRINYRTMAR